MDQKLGFEIETKKRIGETIKSKHSRPIFVIGSPRSGTSVLSHAIAQHSDFWTSIESDFMLPIARSDILVEAFNLSHDRPDEGWIKKHDVSYKEFVSYIGYGIDQLFLSRSGGRRWIEQTPGYTLIADSLKDYFPNALFLHILRDGRSVANSMVNSNFEKLGFTMKWSIDFEAASKEWAFYADKGRDFFEKNKERCFEVRHEDLSSRPESVFKSVFKFLGAEYSQKSTHFVKTKRVNSSFDEGSGTIVDKKNVVDNKVAGDIWDKWDSNRRNIFLSNAGATMEKMGYEIVS